MVTIVVIATVGRSMQTHTIQNGSDNRCMHLTQELVGQTAGAFVSIVLFGDQNDGIGYHRSKTSVRKPQDGGGVNYNMLKLLP